MRRSGPPEQTICWRRVAWRAGRAGSGVADGSGEAGPDLPGHMPIDIIVIPLLELGLVCEE